MILDGGPCPLGIESTVVSVTSDAPALLRPGALPRRAIELVLGAPLVAATANQRGASPGQLATHYAPNTRLRLGATSVNPGEGLLAFGRDVPQGARITINLSQSGNVEEAAAKLFGALRELDKAGADAIAVMPIPAEGLGEAINDRLQRAANRR
jgi:L-threonylcarbamoyladenylate synthase